ncbi:unnamed protein product, partial [Laminaria digitata]
GLKLLVHCYEAWISAQEERIPGLEPKHQSQASEHLDACRGAAQRMRGTTEKLASDARARRAFQLSQMAMVRQQQWSRGVDDLHWYPFQLAFQLLVLESLANPEHPDRSVMDLLWFPTGGGKTEAYLALTAFVVFHRRLAASGSDDGGGVAVLMRYTLRLLTVQQFERAAAMTCACEDVRRREGREDLGVVPISIGLWVGNSATPGTIAQAFALGAGSPTTHKQLTQCPCCRGPLKWELSRRGTRVMCSGK